MISKLNIGLALTKDYNKATLDLVEEVIEYENQEELSKKIREKFEFLKAEVNNQLTTQAKPTIPQNEVEKATDKQKKFLVDLEFKGNTDNLSKEEARVLITELLNPKTSEDY